MKTILLTASLIASGGLWASAAYLSFAPIESQAARTKSVTPEPPTDLVAAYLHCSELAKKRILSASEAQLCADTYHRLKLSFLPELDSVKYDLLSTAERIDAQRRAYAAFRVWREKEAARLASR